MLNLALFELGGRGRTRASYSGLSLGFPNLELLELCPTCEFTQNWFTSFSQTP